MKHCDEFQLDRFQRGRLGWKENIGCRVHLLLCRDCRDNLKNKKDDQIFLDEFRQGYFIMEKAHETAQSIENINGPSSKIKNTTGQEVSNA